MTTTSRTSGAAALAVGSVGHEVLGAHTLG